METMHTLETVIRTVGEVLHLGIRTQDLKADTGLLGALPEFDSMAVVTIITALEEACGIVVEDDEIDAATFETIGSLARFVQVKCG